MQIGRGAQVRRAFAVVGTAIVSASLAHTVGGGAPPGVVTIALALAISAPFAMVVVGGRCSTPRAVFAAVGAQLALHALYSLTPRAGTGTVAPAPAAGSHHHGSGSAMMFSAGAPVHDEHFGPAMLVAHSVAAILTIFAVALADRMHEAVRFAARGVDIARIVLTAPLVPPLTAHVVPAAPRVVGADASSLLCTALRYRGPPRQPFAALAATR
ncbi:hypothetical protein ASD23_00710 [Agromyces sp. Root1464]|uniref:hypothetical protein n=1 Tax=Agromyces sp. Root1464 TaxID=1736467 RepID=UPI0006FC0EB1|nr:hypothetical protein [Agromyces sp. Root1464]KQZ10724.1 hypothetical protein ASD23_00710 [Agromyces sp. Root1464]